MRQRPTEPLWHRAGRLIALVLIASVFSGCMTAAAGALADELLACFELHSVIVASGAALFALIGVALDALFVAD